MHLVRSRGVCTMTTCQAERVVICCHTQVGGRALPPGGAGGPTAGACVPGSGAEVGGVGGTADHACGVQKRSPGNTWTTYGTPMGPAQ